MNTSTHIRAGSAIAIAFILVSAASSAGAINQPRTVGSASISKLGSGNCSLERVRTQFVRCDNLTGAGVPAPSWVPELTSGAALSSQPVRHGSTM